MNAVLGSVGGNVLPPISIALVFTQLIYFSIQVCNANVVPDEHSFLLLASSQVCLSCLHSFENFTLASEVLYLVIKSNQV